MNDPAKFTFQIDRANQPAITVECRPGGYGLDVEVSDGRTKWLFLVDLFHLGYERGAEGPDLEADGCVQIVAYDPRDHDDEPLKHLRVWPDGRTEVFES